MSVKRGMRGKNTGVRATFFKGGRTLEREEHCGQGYIFHKI